MTAAGFQGLLVDEAYCARLAGLLKTAGRWVEINGSALTVEDLAVIRAAEAVAERYTQPTSVRGNEVVSSAEMPSRSNHGEPIDTAAAAELLGVTTRRRAAQLLEAGAIEGERVAGRWFTTRSAVLDYLRTREAC